MKVGKFLKYTSCAVFASLYILVAVISLICSTEFFALAHGGTMSWVLAIGFEIGAMACLLSTLILPRNKQGLVWIMFVILTLFQCMSNTYMAYAHLENFTGWIELFGLNELEPMAQKRILASISGAILPLVALGFIRIMANLISGEKTQENNAEKALPEKEETILETPEEPGRNTTKEKTEETEENRQEERPWEKQDDEETVEETIHEETAGGAKETEETRQEDGMEKDPRTGELTIQPVVIPNIVKTAKERKMNPAVEKTAEPDEKPGVPKTIAGRVFNPSTNEYMD
jgi:hypothetical protein